jgi:putative DNA primase/helicase
MIDAAVAYGRRGWRVFPLKPTSKTPLTPHGLKDATTDEATIRGWWRRWPTANIGFAAGGGVVIVDIDDLGSWTDLLEDVNAPAPNTCCVETSRGVQLYFRTDAPIRNSAGKLRPGIDVRAAVATASCRRASTRRGHVYRWSKNGAPDELPEWLHDLLTAEPSRSTPRVAERSAPASADTPYGRAAVEAETAIVAAALEGTRNDRLNTAALELGQLVAGGELDEHDVRTYLLEVRSRLA